jgi:hypothetical protein
VHENVAEVAAEAGAAIAANVIPRPPATNKGTPMSDAKFRTKAPGLLCSVAANFLRLEGSSVLIFTAPAFHMRMNLHQSIGNQRP